MLDMETVIQIMTVREIYSVVMIIAMDLTLIQQMTAVQMVQVSNSFPSIIVMVYSLTLSFMDLINHVIS